MENRFHFKTGIHVATITDRFFGARKHSPDFQ